MLFLAKVVNAKQVAVAKFASVKVQSVRKENPLEPPLLVCRCLRPKARGIAGDVLRECQDAFNVKLLQPRVVFF